MTVQAAILQGTRLLEEAGTGVPRLTAEVLLCHALKREKSYLYAYPERELSDVERIHYGRYLHERMQGKPTQYITNRQEFYGRDFYVSPAVLIPRPETEHLIEACLQIGLDGKTVLDVGCGSGAIAVTLALESKARVYATDLSGAALEVAHKNADALGALIGFLQADLLAGVASQSIDVIASNPPYVPYRDNAALAREVREYEPELALYGGEDGNSVYARLVADASRVLRPGGWLVMELGFTSLDPVVAMLGPEWSGTRTVDDLAGIPRVLETQLAR